MFFMTAIIDASLNHKRNIAVIKIVDWGNLWRVNDIIRNIIFNQFNLKWSNAKQKVHHEMYASSSFFSLISMIVL